MRNLKARFSPAALEILTSVRFKPSGKGRTLNNFGFLKKATLTSIVIYATYQSLLTALKTESLRKKGLVTRSKQIQILTSSVLSSVSDGVANTLLFGILLLCFPWLSIPFSMIGLVGVGNASIEIFNAFWNGLEIMQQEKLLQASMEAGINLRRFISGPNLEGVFS